MRRGGRPTCLTFFFFYLPGRPERRTRTGTRRAGQSDCAPSEELAERQRAEAIQRERERERLPTWDNFPLSCHLKLGLASSPGKCFRAQLVWVELAGIKPARSWRAASAPPPSPTPPPGTCGRERWRVGAGGGSRSAGVSYSALARCTR